MPLFAGRPAPGRWPNRRTLRALAALGGLVAYAAFVAQRLLPALDVSRQRLRSAIRDVHLSGDEALERYRKADYMAALRRVRETIPEHDAYYLVPADDVHGDYFVRFDLAPRRPVLLENVPVDAPPADAPRWVVRARLAPPGPEVTETAEFFSRGPRP